MNLTFIQKDIYISIIEYLISNKEKYSDFFIGDELNIEYFMEKVPVFHIENILKDLNEKIHDRVATILVLKKIPRIFLISNALEKISLLYNSSELYGVLLCYKNEFDYYLFNSFDIKNLKIYYKNKGKKNIVLKKNKEYDNRKYVFKTGENKHISDLANSEIKIDDDFIIKNYLSFDKNHYISKIIGVNATDTLEEKISKLKKIKTNTKGYHMK